MTLSKVSMTLSKDVKGFGMPWEDTYGYAQAVKVDDTIYVSGQLSHDDHGNIVGSAPLDDSGRIRDHSNMETQMRQTYANAKEDSQSVWRHLGQRGRGSALRHRHGYSVCGSWPSSEGNVWVQEARRGKYHSGDTPVGIANAAD